MSPPFRSRTQQRTQALAPALKARGLFDVVRLVSGSLGGLAAGSGPEYEASVKQLVLQLGAAGTDAPSGDEAELVGMVRELTLWVGPLAQTSRSKRIALLQKPDPLTEASAATAASAAADRERTLSAKEKAKVVYEDAMACISEQLNGQPVALHLLPSAEDVVQVREGLEAHPPQLVALSSVKLASGEAPPAPGKTAKAVTEPTSVVEALFMLEKAVVLIAFAGATQAPETFATVDADECAAAPEPARPARARARTEHGFQTLAPLACSLAQVQRDAH